MAADPNHHTDDSLAGELNRMASQLARTVGTIRDSAESITTAASEIAAGNNDLSQRTERTASSLQTTTSSMDHLSSGVRDSAGAALQAKELAQTASSAVGQGRETMQEAVSSMRQISEASGRIRNIVDVIDGIAFQTNILALNAAVEAARAGELGRGFAVVAAEVRTLAQRSATAAREIKEVIESSSICVEQGAHHVQKAGTSMADIESGMSRLGELVASISAATGDQANNVRMVLESVQEVDHMTQQNSALVEESAAAADSLKDQTQRLSTAVAQFRLPGASVRH